MASGTAGVGPGESWLGRLWADESGQDLIEYVLIIVFVALAVVAALELLGEGVSSRYDTVTDLPNR